MCLCVGCLLAKKVGSNVEWELRKKWKREEKRKKEKKISSSSASCWLLFGFTFNGAVASFPFLSLSLARYTPTARLGLARATWALWRARLLALLWCKLCKSQVTPAWLRYFFFISFSVFCLNRRQRGDYTELWRSWKIDDVVWFHFFFFLLALNVSWQCPHCVCRESASLCQREFALLKDLRCCPPQLAMVAFVIRLVSFQFLTSISCCFLFVSQLCAELNSQPLWVCVFFLFVA